MILNKHFQEWVNSAVEPDIVNLNVISLSQFEPYDRLLYALPDKERRNDGRIRDKWLRRYAHVEHGGWWCNGVDVLTGEDAIWGQFKPDLPYHYKEQSKGFGSTSQAKNKIIKYEPPKNVPTEIFALSVPLHFWKAIALRYDVPLPNNIVVTPEGRAIGFWAWVIDNPKIPIVITEGAKKAGAILTAGYVAIALPGIFNGYRQPKDEWGHKIGFARLIPQLQIFAQEEREIIFCFDNDDKPETVKNVRIAIARTGELLIKNGCRVSVISWNYAEKGVDDLIASKGVHCFVRCYQSRISLSQFKLGGILDLSKYEPLKINQPYLNDSLSSPTEAQIIGIKSPKGSNKTGWLVKIVEQAINDGKPVLVITHRIQLARDLCNRFGIDHIEEVRNSQTKGVLGYGLCIDSLHFNSQAYFCPDDWSEAVIILDECEQVIWHLLDSSTCQENRIIIIQNFQQLLKIAIASGGKVYLSDADLSAIALDYIKDLIATPVQIWVMENIYARSFRRKLIVYSGNDPSEIVASLVKALERGEKTLIHTTGQKARSKWGSINLELYLLFKFPKLKILRIDRDSVSQPGHPAYGCIENLNQMLGNYDVAIASPVIETGVSIDIKGHFDSVWGIAQGVQTVDAVCQTIERLRDHVPRHLWAKKSAKGNRIGNGSTSVRNLLSSQSKLTRSNIALLQMAGIDEFDDLDVSFSSESLITWAKRACIVNLGKNNYRSEIVAKLVLEGYEFISSTQMAALSSQQVRDEIREVCQNNYDCERTAIAKVKTPCDKELSELNNKRTKTIEERRIERKGNLIKRYGIEVTPELIAKDDDGWYPQLQLHFYLTIGKAYLAQRERKSLLYLQDRNQDCRTNERQISRAFIPDINKQQLSAKVRTLELLNIEQFLDPEAEFSRDSLQDWFEQMIQLRFDIQTILGVGINPDDDSAIAVAQRILRKLDLKLQFKYWRGGRKNKQRVYAGCDVNKDNRQRIFEQWLTKI